MIIVHHLNNSRSQRILWLLEELGLDYTVLRYQRDAETNLAPEELKSIHPLGKSPVIDDDGTVIHETGAIVEYLLTKEGGDAFKPAEGSDAQIRYMEWMHYAEGSAMLPLLLALYTGRLGDAAAPLQPRILSEMQNHFSFVSESLKSDYLLGDSLTGADIMMSFPLEAANTRGVLKAFPNLQEYVKRFQARPAYQAALEKGGEYAFSGS